MSTHTQAAQALRVYLQQVKSDTAEQAAIAETLSGSTIVDVVSVQAKLNFWCDQLVAALKRCDRARRDFCDEQAAQMQALLYLMIDNGAEVVA